MDVVAVAILIDAVVAHVLGARMAQLGHRDVRGVAAIVAVALRRRIAVAVEILRVGGLRALGRVVGVAVAVVVDAVGQIFGRARMNAGVGVVAVARPRGPRRVLAVGQQNHHAAPVVVRELRG